MAKNPFAVAVRQMALTAPVQGRPRKSAHVFQGAQYTRLTADFGGAQILSPDQEVRYNLSVLRARARWLVRNNAYATGFVEELANNVIGPDGIMLQAKVGAKKADEKGKKKLNKKTNAAIEEAWAEWSNPEHASADGRDSWVDLQRLIIQTIATDGECFVRKHAYFDNEFGYALQIIDADLVDENLNQTPDHTGRPEIRMGVEVNAFGKPTAYHVLTRHPSEFGTRSHQRIPAEEIEHLFVRYRPNQTRGMTWFAPVLLDVKMLDGYEEAELTAARTAAAKMGFIINNNTEAAAAWQPPEDGVEPRQIDAASGVIDELGPGQTFQEWDPTHPTSAYKEFTKAVLRSIARGLGMAYTTLTGDLEAVNYSSIRAGLLSERDRWRTLQRWLSTVLHRRVYREWLEVALLSGMIQVDSRLASNYYDVAWKPRGWKWVDPVNDLTAAALSIGLGLDSRQRLAAEQGRDYEDVIEEIAHEQGVADEAGVDITGTLGKPAASAPGEDPNDPNAPDDEDTDDEDEEREEGDAPTPKQRKRALRLASHLLTRKVS